MADDVKIEGISFTVEADKGIEASAKKLDKLTDSLERLSKAMSGLNTAPLSKLLDVTDRISKMNPAGVGKLATALSKINSTQSATKSATKNLSDLTSGMKDATTAAEKVQDPLSAVYDVADRFKSVGDIFSAYKASMGGGQTATPGVAQTVEDTIEKLYAQSEAVNKLSADIATVGDQFRAQAAEVGASEPALNRTASIWDNIKSKTADVWNNLRGNAKAISDLDSKMTSLAGSVQNLSAQVKGMFTGQSNFQSFLEGLGPGIKAGIGNVLKGIGSGLQGIGSVLKTSGAMADFDSLMDRIAGSGSALAPLVSAARSVADAFSRTWKSMGDAGTVKKLFASLTASGYQLTHVMAKLAMTPISKLGDALSSVQKKMNTLFAAIGRIAVYRGIRAAIKQISQGLQEGMKNLYAWSELAGNQFSASMDRIATSSLYLKNSFAAMTAPLMNALAPAIDALIDKFVSLLNVINQVFALLTGASMWVKAEKSATKWGDETSKAAGRAKKAMDNFTVSLDELHVIDPDAGSSGGSGAATPDYSSMFSNQPVDESLKKQLESSDWTDLGLAFAEKINDAMASIDWESIQKNAQTWATRIYTFFNGAVKGLDWKLVGRTFAQGINTVTGFVDTILNHGIDWKTIGASFAEGAKSMVDTIDWETLGSSLTGGFTVVFDTLHGFMEESTSDGFWDSLREGISEGVNGMFSNIDLSQAMVDIAGLVSELLLVLSSAISAIPWASLGKSIIDGIMGIPWPSLIGGVFSLVWSIIEASAQFIFDGLLRTTFEYVVGFFGWLGETIGGMFSGIVESVSGWFELTRQTAGASMVGIGADVSGFFLKIILDIGKFGLDIIKKVGEILEKVGKKFTDLVDDAFNWGKDLIEGFKRGLEEAKSGLFDKVSGIAGKIAGYIHFSRPDFGPLRDYETWMPDMIQGLTITLNSSSSQLFDATANIAKQVADNLSSISDISAIDVGAGTLSVTGTGAADSTDMKDAFMEAIREELMPMVESIDQSARIQANKDESINVQIGSRDVASAVTEQKAINGYSFVTEGY